MNHHYRDITGNLGTPLWWDEFAVPRYCEFSPGVCADVYADEVVLLEIHCQNCSEPFHVAMSTDKIGRLTNKVKLLREQIVDGSIHYGDPPNNDCCPAGPTMNSVPMKVCNIGDDLKTLNGSAMRHLKWR